MEYGGRFLSIGARNIRGMQGEVPNNTFGYVADPCVYGNPKSSSPTENPKP